MASIKIEITKMQQLEKFQSGYRDLFETSQEDNKKMNNRLCNKMFSRKTPVTRSATSAWETEERRCRTYFGLPGAHEHKILTRKEFDKTMC